MVNFKAGLIAAVCLVSCAITQAQEPANQAVVKPIWVSGGSLYIIIPADRRKIVAYSSATSKMTTIECDAPLPNDAVPVVGDKIAFVQTGRTVYAVGNDSESWAKLTLPRDGMKPAIDGTCVRVSDDKSFFVFGPAANAWSGIDLQSGEPIHKPNGG